jgi:hypothetical protein
MTTTSQKQKSADRHALRAGFTIEEIFNLTKIDRWFLVQIKEMWTLRRNWLVLVREPSGECKNFDSAGS